MKTMTMLLADIDRLSEADLRDWIAAAWLSPLEEAGSYLFTAAEEARVRLIIDMHYDMGVEAETMPLVLSLLDQLYDARRQLRALGNAITVQPDDVRSAILALIQNVKDES